MKTCPECSREWPDDAQFCGVDATRLVDTSEAEVEELIVGHYRILERLGAGGMGAVYVGEHLSLGRRDAIKMLNRSFADDDEALARFHREAQNASTIHHENVCVVYDFGETPEGLSFLAMELVDGVSLEELLEQEGGSLDPTRAAAIVGKVADGLQAAHDRSIVHRDLKPGNVMVASRPDGSDAVKVVDFGIAKAVDKLEDQQITRIGLVAGTREYMSPEHLRGEEADPRSDIYALGVVLFRTLTGQFPFTGAYPGPIPRRLSDTKPDVAFPPGLQNVIDQSLAHDSRERYASSRDFGRALAEAMHPPATVTHGGVSGATLAGKKEKKSWTKRGALLGTVAAGSVAAAFAWSAIGGGPELALDQGDLSMPAGGSVTVRALMASSGGESVPASDVSWSTEDGAVASVTRDGVVTAGRTAGGSTTLSAVVGTDTVSIRVEVVAGAPASVALLSPTRLRVNDSREFAVEVTDEFGNVVDDLDLTWASSDPNVLSVDSDGNGIAGAAGSTTLSVEGSNVFGPLNEAWGVSVSSTQQREDDEPQREEDPNTFESEARITLRRLCQEAPRPTNDEAWAQNARVFAERVWTNPSLGQDLKGAAAEVLEWAFLYLGDETTAAIWEGRSPTSACVDLTGSAP